MSVYCMEDGWTVIQSRGQFENPKDYFYKPWNTYLQPFGTPGKQEMYLLTISQFIDYFDGHLISIMW
jgi:hypothetical protein